MTDLALTRRRSIAIGAGVLTAGAAGIALGTDRAGASADVTLGTLDAEDATFSPEDGSLTAVWLLVSGRFEYQVNADPADWQAYALVGDGSGATEAIALASGAADARQGSGTYALRGPITAASFYDSSDFAVPDRQHSVTVSIPVTVVFLVRDSGGKTLVQARVSDDAMVTVDDARMPKASLAGSATIAAQDDAGDPTPEA